MKSYTVERIKKEALLLCEVNDGEDIGSLSLDELLGTDKYAVYLRGMDASINRCLRRFAEERVLPLREFEIPYDPEVTDNLVTCDVSEFTTDVVDDIVQCDLVKDDGRTLYEGMRFGHIGDGHITVPALSSGYHYVIKYRYAPKEINPFGYDSFNEVLDLDDRYASLIPYYVFGEVYRHTEPNMANAYGTQYFEERLAQLSEVLSPAQTKMENAFKGYN